MKALSIKQPWAWLIVNGHKAVENRSWNTKFRGEFYIHASKSWDKNGYEWVKLNFPEIKMPNKEEFEKGGVVGRANLINTVHISDKRLLTSSDVPWFIGEYGFILDNMEVTEFQPLKGSLGFFEVVKEVG